MGWFRPSGIDRTIASIHAISTPTERLGRYADEVTRRLRYPKLGSTPWGQDQQHIAEAVRLLEVAGDDSTLQAGRRADALEAVKLLSFGSDSPLQLAKRAEKGSGGQMIDSIRNLADTIEGWKLADLDARIAQLRREQQHFDDALGQFRADATDAPARITVDG